MAEGHLLMPIQERVKRDDADFGVDPHGGEDEGRWDSQLGWGYPG